MPSATLERILDEVKRLTPGERRQLRGALEREAARAAGVRAPLVTRVESRDELPFAGC
jgi:hypothetical protein